MKWKTNCIRNSFAFAMAIYWITIDSNDENKHNKKKMTMHVLVEVVDVGAAEDEVVEEVAVMEVDEEAKNRRVIGIL